MKKYKGLKTLEVLEGAKNYNNWITEQVAKHLIYPAFEIGSGTGNITELLLTKGKVYGSDCDTQLVSYLKQKFNRKTEVFHLNIEKTIIQKYKNKLASICAVNVLEHIKDDNKALRHVFTMLRPGGRIVLLVPAKRFAFTKLDKSLGHYRRYEKDEINSKLQKVGFTSKKIYFFNIVGLLSWVIRDRVEQEHIQLSAFHIALFDAIVPLLRIIESIIPMPIGISLIAVAVKPKKQ